MATLYISLVPPPNPLALLNTAIVESHVVTDPITGVTTLPNGNRTISYSTPGHSLMVEIFLPQGIRRDLASLKVYTSFLDE